MRNITINAINAFMNGYKFRKGNTAVDVLPNVTVLKLFGNEIAYRYNDPENTLLITNSGWFSATTKERLNGIPGVSIAQIAGNWYLNGEIWYGNLLEVKQ